MSEEQGRQGERPPGDERISPGDEWLTVTALARELGVTKADVMARIEEIPHYQLGPDVIRFRRSEIGEIRGLTSG